MSKPIYMKKEDFEELINSAISEAIGKFTTRKPEDPLFTEEEASKYLKLSSVTLWQKRKEGLIVAVKSGRRNLYSKSSLDAFLGLEKEVEK